MNSHVRPVVLLSLVFAFVLVASPAFSGDFFFQSGCDTTASDATTYSLVLMAHGGEQVCEVQFRPKALGALAAEPIMSWEVPPGWTAEPIAGEPGAIVLHGCVHEYWFTEGFKITMPGRAGNIQGWAYGPTGRWSHNHDVLFFCGSNPTPAAPATWGKVKSLYR